MNGLDGCRHPDSNNTHACYRRITCPATSTDKEHIRKRCPREICFLLAVQLSSLKSMPTAQGLLRPESCTFIPHSLFNEGLDVCPHHCLNPCHSFSSWARTPQRLYFQHATAVCPPRPRGTQSTKYLGRPTSPTLSEQLRAPLLVPVKLSTLCRIPRSAPLPHAPLGAETAVWADFLHSRKAVEDVLAELTFHRRSLKDTPQVLRDKRLQQGQSMFYKSDLPQKTFLLKALMGKPVSNM